MYNNLVYIRVSGNNRYLTESCTLVLIFVIINPLLFTKSAVLPKKED